MRSAPTDDDDLKDLAKLNAEPWQVECLSLNPNYVHWGPREDYMCKAGDGWDSRLLRDTWEPIELDDLNEVVNFYFTVKRASKECDACQAAGYNPATKRISDDFYALHLPHGSSAWRAARWNDRITQDEVDALVAHDRLRTFDPVKREWVSVPRTAAEVNEANRGGGMLDDLNHDGLNQCILIETRAKRLGVWGMCETCDGEGSVFTEPAAKLGLVLWLLHPRKGAARGVEYAEIKRGEIPSVLQYLATAAERNAARFAKVCAAATAG